MLVNDAGTYKVFACDMVLAINLILISTIQFGMYIGKDFFVFV